MKLARIFKSPADLIKNFHVISQAYLNDLPDDLIAEQCLLTHKTA